MKIEETGEFGLIGRIADQFRELIPAGCEGIGDDCAVIPAGSEESFVVTTDMLIERSHFLRDRITPYELGRKALAVNLSDIASMGASPLATFLSLGLPTGTDTEWCDRFFEGYRSLGVPLLGGDTTASPAGIVINVTVIGTAPNSCLKRRSAARPGDRIAVTGFLGDSAGGLQALLQGLPEAPDTTELIHRHHTPHPHLEEGLWLGRQSAVHAMMDISDGLASDLEHILQASGCTASVDTDLLPLSELLRRTAATQHWNPTDLAATGGEDYVLLCTVDGSSAEQIAADFQTRFGRELSIIGTIEEGSGPIRWIGEAPTRSGFQHF